MVQVTVLELFKVISNQLPVVGNVLSPLTILLSMLAQHRLIQHFDEKKQLKKCV